MSSKALFGKTHNYAGNLHLLQCRWFPSIHDVVCFYTNEWLLHSQYIFNSILNCVNPRELLRMRDNFSIINKSYDNPKLRWNSTGCVCGIVQLINIFYLWFFLLFLTPEKLIIFYLYLSSSSSNRLIIITTNARLHLPESCLSMYRIP